MMIDGNRVYDQGLRDPSVLKGAERLLFILQDFDNLMEMEGWDHFFLYEHHFCNYSEMKEWLRTIGDDASLKVLGSYEEYLDANSIAMTPDAIGRFLETQDDAALQACPVWRELYSDLRPTRWQKVEAYLHSQRLELKWS